MKYGLNRRNIRLFSQQVGWLGGKKELNSILRVPRINIHK
jgi:hypothetical protein